MTRNKTAVVLLSGGLDSVTVLAIAKAEGLKCHTLTFSYGQRHSIEIEAAMNAARAMSVKSHLVVDIDSRLFNGSALTDEGPPVPKNRSMDSLREERVPTTYVPARNTVFLAMALARAEVVAAERIFIGVSAVDYSGYPDCRPEFIEAFEDLTRVATRTGVEGRRDIEIVAPLLRMSKAQTIRRGLELGVDYSHTHTCYDPNEEGAACGLCDACLIRLRAFSEVGISDPAPYV